MSGTHLCYSIGKFLRKILIMIKRCFFVRVSRGAWLGARVCNWAVARAARVHPWPRALEAGPTHIQNALIFLSVFNKIYLSIYSCINCCKIKLSFSENCLFLNHVVTCRTHDKNNGLPVCSSLARD